VYPTHEVPMQTSETLSPQAVARLDHGDGMHVVASPAPSPAPTAATLWRQRIITSVIIVAPFAALAMLFGGVIDNGLAWWNLVLAAVFYVVVALGVTVGFHRLFTHRSFEARRPLKIALAVAGSLSFQGSIIGWVAEHRRHHTFTDRPGDPHSPVRPETQPYGRTRGFLHAHVGWFFTPSDTSRQRYAPDLLADRDIVFVDRLFVPLCVATLAVPFLIGYAFTGRISAGIAALLLAGLVRIGLLHHVAWSTNSVCHMFGTRPFRTSDRSTNFAPLAVLSMGESWHNAHHAFPAMARHGVDAHQVDLSAMTISLFERLGLASRVRWPDPIRLDSRRR
jgi:stearoyl-CoA desaturase (delta-9 desaturase)